MLINCNCKCGCQQKLLTNTSIKRNQCSGCFLGNCKGKVFLTKYFSGKFEINHSKSIQDSYSVKLDEMKKAYPMVNNVVESKTEN